MSAPLIHLESRLPLPGSSRKPWVEIDENVWEKLDPVRATNAPQIKAVPTTVDTTGKVRTLVSGSCRTIRDSTQAPSTHAAAM